MKAQTPAQGILSRRDYGDAKTYTVVCECGCDNCKHEVWVEAESSGVTVTTYTTQKTDFWTENVKKDYSIENTWLQEFDWFWKDLWNGLVTRLRLTKDIWWNGYAKYEASIVMNEQQALNYAETLKSAVADVKEFKKPVLRENTQAVKAAQEGDCV